MPPEDVKHRITLGIVKRKCHTRISYAACFGGRRFIAERATIQPLTYVIYLITKTC